MENVALARDLMLAFAERTGLTGTAPARRYLWTDAFAVCNFLGFAAATGEARWRELALRLVGQVHHVLGRHRDDDPRRGWISGLVDVEGERHPTVGGLRIGKELPERTAAEHLDQRREWDRDGQYFHYLTKWTHALDQVARATGDARSHHWARELFDVAHRAFTYGPEGARRMVWKLSVDLSRPLIPSMGQHDPLDGFVTGLQLESTAALLGLTRAGLAAPRADFASMIDRAGLATPDPLGIGGLLFDAGRLVQLEVAPELVTSLLAASALGLARWIRTPDLHAPARERLAFRELGLAIGLSVLPLLDRARLDASGQMARNALARFAPLRDDLLSFWLVDAHREGSSWIEHRDIDEVMLATALAPRGFLELATPPSAIGLRASSRQ
jgi:hypothetical protein